MDESTERNRLNKQITALRLAVDLHRGHIGSTTQAVLASANLFYSYLSRTSTSTEINRVLANHDRRITQLEDYVTTLDEALTQINAETNRLGEEIDTVGTEISAAATAIADLQNRLATHNQALADELGPIAEQLSASSATLSATSDRLHLVAANSVPPVGEPPTEQASL